MNQDIVYSAKKGPTGYPDPIREAWILRFDLAKWHINPYKLSDALLFQLSQCKNDEARRLILGMSC